MLGVLLEPMTVITKALEQIFVIGRRSYWRPKTMAVTGAGPIGLLAALRLVANGFDVHVIDRIESGPKPQLVRDMGATYHTGSMLDLPFQPDAIVECTGVGFVITDAVQKVGSGGIVCLTGIGVGGHASRAVADVAAAVVLKNTVIVGSVNANKRHWYRAGENLARSDRNWLSRVITR